MDGDAGWWATSRKIGLPALARVKGVGMQHQSVLLTCCLDDFRLVISRAKTCTVLPWLHFSSVVLYNRIIPFVYTFSGIFVELLMVMQSAGMCKLLAL